VPGIVQLAWRKLQHTSTAAPTTCCRCIFPLDSTNSTTPKLLDSYTTAGEGTAAQQATRRGIAAEQPPAPTAAPAARQQGVLLRATAAGGAAAAAAAQYCCQDALATRMQPPREKLLSRTGRSPCPVEMQHHQQQQRNGVRCRWFDQHMKGVACDAIKRDTGRGGM